ncbi:hypothetical protein A2631_05795 [Candidatus Daviesbacteria bacterium RIFCSPHIGHO2_01_FULL_44_29]|uniref:PDZ domain-containing protein n=1 Tax=Candidatus Daviesbacteria bacterium RIFCSPHIGHO2_02_FULL_43_12 TaxID=1797776 RepID=A0A1F5KIK2_9BACT|nr:MAG: hypothetical protein A2631_05795 [Candidatus Daviesbacteria bacterium RIFCSPHIGHO2_01_FULL_44_29]OGE39475.1 MAG: hypothetical protein A3E86_03965 [Candidatus Daviesbacteria bacterium RIFCSPHIGHO2_12_FULL_47_45]OGE40635.1 MAG: hypothetical protein A3D25_05755 [Candidatus Daviesbacteria bacterium RIFCSPHIGHO2_02_FULL_43_12]OGE69868.1 MAG: hypothetical protein A3B55_05670 [Candidatus Daviesbacteria bacterium RIFCSPLOWO2_01_FULL_43_15]
MAILVFIVTILILVVLHELGHFLAAKRFNIKVLEFGFGIPPRVFGKKWGETLVSLNWLPFGGFVKLLGEDEDDPDALKSKRSFASQTVWKRIAVVVAGVTMNLSLAWLLYWIILGTQSFKTQIPLLTPYHFVGVSQTNENIILISSVAKNSPAELAHLQPGDRISEFNGEFLNDSDQFIQKIKESAGTPVTLTITDIQRITLRTVTVIPRQSPPPGEGSLGVALGSVAVANLEYKGVVGKILSAPIHSYNLTVYSVAVLSETINKAISSRNLAPVSNTVSGPVGITHYISDILAIKNPLLPYLEFLAMLSLNLAIVNILPFPGLDGGRLFFLLWEACTRKKVSPLVEKYIHSIGLVVLIGLIILVTASDIKKLF